MQVSFGVTMQKNEIIEILKGREVIYAVCSDIYLFIPEEKYINALYTVIKSFKDITVNNENKVMVENLKKLEQTVEDYYNADKIYKQNILEEIHKAYTRLFCLGNAVPLSESVFVSPEHLTKQVSEDKVINLYMQCQFDMHHTANEPKDHLSYELMFMSYLSKGTYNHIINDNIMEASKLVNLQKYFLNNHLLNWISLFRAVLEKYNEKIDFYKPITIFLENYLQADKEYLETLEF